MIRFKIYILGESGIRHEDTLAVTEYGCENLTKWSGTPEEPALCESASGSPVALRRSKRVAAGS